MEPGGEQNQRWALRAEAAGAARRQSFSALLHQAAAVQEHEAYAALTSETWRQPSQSTLAGMVRWMGVVGMVGGGGGGRRSTRAQGVSCCLR